MTNGPVILDTFSFNKPAYIPTASLGLFTLLGRFVQCEMHTFTGRIDCKLETKDFIYLFEFKRDDTPEAALKQIDEMQYALAYAADPRILYKIGVGFDSKKRILDGKILKGLSFRQSVLKNTDKSD